MSHVVHLITQLGWGGAENLVRGMARRQRERGWQVTVVAMDEPVCDAADLDVRCLHARGPFDAPGYLRLRRLLRGLRPQVVHVHLLWSELWGIPAARAAGAPAVITAHCTYDARAQSLPVRLCSRAVVRRAAATIAISHAVARYRLERCGDRPDRIQVVNNGVELDQYVLDGRREGARAHFQLPPNATVIGTVARLHWSKGIDTFIRAAALGGARSSGGRTGRAFPWNARTSPVESRADQGAPGSDVRFLIAGGGPEESRLRALAASLGLDRHVVFAGELPGPQARDALAAMDIFVLPSVREGLGIALIEAMAAGLPVVASDCEGIAEVVEDRRSGLLFPPGDAPALAAKLDLLLRRPQLAQALGAAARARVRDKFSLSGMVAQVEQVYHSAIRGHTADDTSLNGNHQGTKARRPDLRSQI